MPKEKLKEVLGALASQPDTTATASTTATAGAAEAAVVAATQPPTPPVPSGEGGAGGGSGGGGLLPWSIAHDDAAVSALTANLETAGAGIILWDDFWRCVR